MKSSTLVLILLFTIFAIQAQSVEPKASFVTSTHDFGEISENGGSVSCEFRVKNIGSKPLLINNVQASCGCTTPDWTKKPILPGEEGMIKATYNPLGRPGDFNKAVTVFTNDETKRYVLRIVGKVAPRQKTIEEQFPYTMGDLRLKYNSQSMMTMTNKEQRTKEIPVFNSGDGSLKITFNNIPESVSATAVPSELGAKKEGMILITYDASKKNDFDYVRDWIYVTVNGKNDSKNRIMISAKIVEDFSTLSDEEINNAPKAVFPTTNYNFGTIREGETAEFDFVVENQGKSNLIIRKIKSSCGCTAAMPGKKIIAPGEKTVIAAKFNSRGKKGNNYKTITVVTNSPSQSSQVLSLKGIVN